jgi:hypothetical protein
MTIVRRKGLGFGSAKGIIGTLAALPSPITAQEWLSWQEASCPPADVYLRWGCTTNIPRSNGGGPRIILNKAGSIHQVTKKGTFASLLATQGLSPTTLLSGSRLIVPDVIPLTGKWVVRPMTHSQGRNLFVMNGSELLIPSTPTLMELNGEWYARPLINKVAEVRVTVMFGKVVNVANKNVKDKTAVAWNADAGSSYSSVRWGEWDMRMCTAAMKAAEMSGLDYAAVDIMVEEGTLTPWVCEVNSGGSVHVTKDGEPTYRAKCVGKAFGWHLQRESYKHWALPIVRQPEGWRDVIHPGVWEKHPANEVVAQTHESVQVSRPEFVSSRGENA